MHSAVGEEEASCMPSAAGKGVLPMWPQAGELGACGPSCLEFGQPCCSWSIFIKYIYLYYFQKLLHWIRPIIPH